MDFMAIWKWLTELTWGDVDQWFQRYEALGPLPGILLPLAESLLPFLPLIAIVIANAEAYGLWEGFLYSWIGSVSGSFIVFLLVRRFGARFRDWIERKLVKSNRLIEWVERKGFTVIFTLSCFPFTPSFLLNVVSGLSRLPIPTFLTAIFLGKGVMVFLISFVGYDLSALFHNPLKLILAVLLFFAMWLIGRQLESRYMR